MLGSLAMQKPITRRTVLLRRDTMPELARIAAGDLIADSVMQLVARFPKGEVIGLYAPKGTEVDTARIDAFARARGLRIAYPRVADNTKLLAFHETTIEALEEGHFSLREPRADAPSLELSAIAAFIIPGLAFDRHGGRVGWGRGYYDVTLAAANPQALRIGLAFECQLVEQVPRDPHDMHLHYVVTEAAVYRAAD
ncbi:MAG TPA: 5-formyltetrahydrofolate cyclo-ligase [Kofleriaceae bacterium]|nr:5-formyltetrahydrofolate cyclo-ligase [Kofleriaceae bacterium]